MKLLFINPPVENMIQTELPEAVRSETGVFPPLGLMYLMSYLNKFNPGHEIYLLDAIAEALDGPAVNSFVNKFSPAVVGITVYTHNLFDVRQIVENIKRDNPCVKIVLGGPHVSLFPEETMMMPGVDIVIKGEAEVTFSELLDNLACEGDLMAVKGILFKDNDQVFQTCSRELVADLDSFPFPDRWELNNNLYNYTLSGKTRRITTMISSRGCPFGCAYCSTPRGRYRVRSVKNIVDEMEECAQLGIEEIHFVDDSFGCRASHLESLCAEIKQRRLDLQWGVRVRVDSLSQVRIRQLKESGCIRINIGVETSSDEGLKILRKGITVDQVRAVVGWAKAAGLTIAAYFMIGCPHEKTANDIQRTIDFAVDLDVDYAMFNILTLYPGTKLHEMAVAQGLIEKDYWRQFACSPRSDFLLPFWEQHLDRKELIHLLRKAYRSFYLRPKKIGQIIRNTGGVKDVLKKAKTGVKIMLDRG